MTAQVSTILAIVASTLALGGLMWRLLAPVLRISRFLHGEDGDDRRGVPARPGILERQTTTERLVTEQAVEIAELRAMLREALAQLRNNGGSSMKDVIDKTYAAVTASAQ